MGVSVCWVLTKMDVRHSMFKLLLFQILVAWCGAKHITIDSSLPKVQFLSENLQEEVQDSIRNIIHTGIYSHRHLDTSQVQVTTPVKVTRDGALVSRDLAHAHAIAHSRRRRDLADHRLPHEVHYNLTIDGKELRLDLRPSVTFVGPALIVERHRVDKRTRERPHPDSTSCHYTGSVRGQPSSSIALSACDGLAGLLRTEHGEYLIEPSNQIPTDSSQGRPHVIYKRSAVDKLKAHHRNKREVDRRSRTDTHSDNLRQRYNNNRYMQNQQRNPYNASKRERQNKLDMDRRRREYLEERRRRLEAIRRNPIEYRRQQARLRMEQRRSQSSSKSISGESKSIERNKALKFKKRKNELRPRHIKNRRRKKRGQPKNCGTKQPPYQWKIKNLENYELEQHRRAGYNRTSNNPHQYRRGSRWMRRSARSVSKPRHVEVLLVADRSMTEFHNVSNLETYLLTIMNMVSSLYMDPSIGNYIKVVVVKIIFVEELGAAPDLEVTSNADTTLTSFCRWQQQLNPYDDQNPHHHDVAILITREDICSQHGKPCSTLGVAHVAGMCKPDLSCSVNEDNGIMLAHTITHELGHNFGLYHDTEKIGCHRREGSTLHIMTPIFESDTVQVAWSRCSKRDVTNFLDAGMGDCLSDEPSEDEHYMYPEVPAGVMFDAATQCHLQFGAEAVVCAKPSELCEHLWCLVNNTCISMLRPAAPGTTCGPNMWCQNQTCVVRTGTPVPRDGGWGQWGAWSECSRTCGAGVTTQTRECDSPEPNHNGNYCIGERSRYRICNEQPCPIGEPTFREVQCSKYNNKTFDNITVSEWVPYFDQDRPCELKCVSRDVNDLELKSAAFVADGTPCRQNIGSRDMCIAGVCYRVGCDWRVNSEMEDDACGVCGGNGSECKTVQGIYSKGTTKQSGFSEVAVIPAGSRNVKIQEKVSPGNYISIGSAKSRRIYLSGARNATLTEYFVAGAQAIYERDRDWEKVRISGPIAEDIKVYQRIFRGRHRNPGVTYQYTVDRQRPSFSYRLSGWSPCSATCGDALKTRELECVDEHNNKVDMSQCYHMEQPRVFPSVQRCNLPKCTHWWVGAWNPCSKPCHMPGEEATKQRRVYCVDKQSNGVIDDSNCDLATKPISVIQCADVPAC